MTGKRTDLLSRLADASDAAVWAQGANGEVLTVKDVKRIYGEDFLKASAAARPTSPSKTARPGVPPPPPPGGWTPPPQPVAKPMVFTRASSLTTPAPPREWLVPEVIPMGCSTSLYGSGGAGKTLLLQILMTTTATNKPWCGLPTRHCGSIGYFCEDDSQDLHRRQDAINQALGVRAADLGAVSWHSVPPSEDSELAQFSRDGKMSLTRRYYEIMERARDEKVGAIILDSLYNIYSGNENDRQQVGAFGRAMNSLGAATKAAVVWSAHPSRAGMNTGQLDGGSTAWRGTVRSGLTLDKPDNAAPGDFRSLVLKHPKNNHGPRHADIMLRWVNGVIVPTFGAGSMLRRPSVDEVFLDLVRTQHAIQGNVSNNPSSRNYAPKEFAKRVDGWNYGVREFEQAMHRLFQQGVITRARSARTSIDWGTGTISAVRGSMEQGRRR